WVEAYFAGRLPSASVATPSLWMATESARVDGATGFEDRSVAPGVSIARRDEADGAVEVLLVVPGDEVVDPCTRMLEARERTTRVLGAILERPEESFREGVVVADSRPAEGRGDAEALHRRLEGRALHRAAVVLMNDET